MQRFAMIAGLALCLSACGGTVPPASNSTMPAPEATPAPAPTIRALTADAMYGAEALYNVPAHAYVTADAKGLLPAATKAAVKPYLIAAYDALKKARLFYKAGDAAAFWAARLKLQNNADEAGKLIPK